STSRSAISAIRERTDSQFAPSRAYSPNSDRMRCRGEWSGIRCVTLSEPEALQLAGRGLRQLGHELDRLWVLVRRDLGFHEVLQLGGRDLARAHHVRLDQHP